MCPICGCIEDENRPNQETFACIDCGHSENADFNAAINIRNRVSVAVLRNRLLKQNDNGSFIPSRMKREDIKKFLLSVAPFRHTAAMLREESVFIRFF